MRGSAEWTTNVVRALELCALDGGVGVEFRIFTDSQAAMVRMQSDQSGPGQEMARRGIQIARRGLWTGVLRS